MPTFKIKVLASDIEDATRGHSGKCMVAEAIERAVPAARRVEVDSQTIRFTLDGERRAYLTPMLVELYVAAFDNGEIFAPFDFSLYEKRMLVTKRDTVTEAGKNVKRLDNKARRARAKAVAAQATLPMPTPGTRKSPAVPIEVQATVEKAERLTAEAEAVRKATKEPRTARTAEGERPRRRVQGRNVTRVLGNRQLRINQDGHDWTALVVGGREAAQSLLAD